MKNPPHFGEGFKLFFGFQKKGGGGVGFARNANRKGLVLPKLVCDALDRASPDSKRLGDLQYTLTPRKLLSHLAFVDGPNGERLARSVSDAGAGQEEFRIPTRAA